MNLHFIIGLQVGFEIGHAGGGCPRGIDGGGCSCDYSYKIVNLRDKQVCGQLR